MKYNNTAHCNRSRCLLEDLLGWIRHLCAEEAQRLETLADGMDVGHTHKHHLTVRVVLYRGEQHVIIEWGILFDCDCWRSTYERVPGHSHPPPLALLATAAAYDLASRIRSFWGWMASVSTSALLVIEESIEKDACVSKET